MAKCINAPYFLWRIDNYCSIDMDVSSVLISMDLKWQLRFIRYMKNCEIARLVLECLSVPEPLSDFTFEVDVYNVQSDGTHNSLNKSTYSLKGKEWCIWKNDIESIIYDNGSNSEHIVFAIMIAPTDGVEMLFKKQKSVEEINHESACMKSLTGDFGKLFINSEHSDFVLICSGKEFRVHKAVLSARSEYFAAMFRSNMKEATEGIGKIEGIEPDVLELILRYLYTGEVSEFSLESLPNVYAASDRFDIELLKITCYLLFIDSFKNSPEEVTTGKDKELRKRSKQTKVVEAESQTMKEFKLLKDLFMSRVWASFSQEFPLKALEMCKQYLLKKM